MSNKKYLFASYTDFGSGKLTGAHRRFLELLTCVAQTSDVTFVGAPCPQLEQFENITIVPLDRNAGNKLPKHLAGGYAIYKTIKEHKKAIVYDYAISFSPVTSVCYHLAGVKHIVSLFREDLIGYQKALSASFAKLAYFQLQEQLAVRYSEKIIVQCVNDRNNLIARNQHHCPNLSDKVYIQINNANASWMRTDSISSHQPVEAPSVLFVGNFSDRRKGHFLLLPAAMRLLDEGYRFKLLCAGDGQELDYWKTACSQHPDIRFLGQVCNMHAYLAKADLMLVPSLIDSCPNTVLEGLNAGVAVYGSNTGGIPDLLPEPQFLFQPDEESLYLFLKEILCRRRYIEDAVRQRKFKEALSFDWGKKIQEIIEI